MKNVSLSDLKAFLLVARLQSFQQAAGELGVSRSALSHAMRALETRLGVRLLHRTTRSVSLTQQGAAFLQRLDPLLNALDDVLDSTRFQPQELHGTLRINANEGGARWLLQHVVVDFLRAHPQVELDLVTDGRLVDIVAAGFDAGVRLAEAVPRDMIAVPFGGDIRFITIAAPAYLEQAGTPQTPEDLLQHRCIAQRLPGGKRYRWEFMRDGKPLTLNVPGTLCLDNSALMVEAVVLGLGIAYVPEPYARQALNDGLAVQVLETWCPPIAGLCLYYASHRHVPATLRAFIAAIRAVA
ncbi:LysR family transcriptional regulator [Kosakonia oryzae]|uniref:DNA-binding transcriptional regulator, LysR family n=1 Tax=Kosakonia oryzae TaxID=497725 RepID=A0AA94KPC8_9ENTR|nr:LysR family transcriptional regulator [Kosakonia oryzae]ANI83072.1 LysR family transcriptional regulator [Kosakonia oryzae]UDJ80232.1 LysR family transcriptional regulator [Kosakonia oryzae]SFC10704.1 DNA-binding transcriptional regulator, LysR family [Kosakonia oryzae]